MFWRARRRGVGVGGLAPPVFAVLLLAMVLGPPPSQGNESAVQDRPAPSSVEGMQGSLARGFEKKPDRPAGPFR